MEQLAGRTAVITGAASGIGRALALRFAADGMAVVLADIDERGLAEVEEIIGGIGAPVLTMTTDVGQLADQRALLDATLDRFGAANVVCLNAGVTGAIGRSWTLDESDWQWSLGVLLDGVRRGVSTFVPHLVDHGDGHVVITASVVGHIAAPYSAPYAVAKHGVVALAESLALELAADESPVGVSCVCPGFVDTALVRTARERIGPVNDPAVEGWLAMSERALGAGASPERVAALVRDAVLDRTFWVFTDTMWDRAIRSRTEAILGGRAPEAGLPTFE